MDSDRNVIDLDNEHQVNVELERRNNEVIFADHLGRMWTASAIDDFVVGRLRGKYHITQIHLYITFNHSSLVSITIAELETFWNDTLMKTLETSLVTFWTQPSSTKYSR